MEAPASSPACVLRVIGPKDATPPGATVVNTTSRTKEPWSRGLSPFFVGPIPLYGGYQAQNLENAWQYCKVYEEHLTASGDPSEAYWTWAKEGWNNPKAVRFPMGKGAKPAYSFWDGEKLDYIAARKKIYAPLYASAVAQTEAFYRLKELYDSSRGKEIYLWDFDGYDHINLGRNLDQVLADPTRKMGHAFVLCALLTRPQSLPWGQPAPPALGNLKQLQLAREAAITSQKKQRECEAEAKREARRVKKASKTADPEESLPGDLDI